jgi:hypothetical protein
LFYVGGSDGVSTQTFGLSIPLGVFVLKRSLADALEVWSALLWLNLSYKVRFQGHGLFNSRTLRIGPHFLEGDTVPLFKHLEEVVLA